MTSVPPVAAVSKVYRNNKSIASLVAFMAVLKHDNRTLESLNVSRVIAQLYYHLIHDHVAQVVGEMLKFNQSLKEIYLQKLSLTDHDLELIVKGLIENKTLEVLDLACNQIGDFGMEFLCEYLNTSPPLKKLILHHNHLGDSGARAFSFKYPVSKIEYLDISENRLTENGVLDILNCLRKPYPIEYFFIRGNKLGPKVFKVVYRMLQSGVLHEDRIDVRIYKTTEKVDGQFVTHYQCAHNCYNDHAQPKYYALCVDTKKEKKRSRSPSI